MKTLLLIISSVLLVSCNGGATGSQPSIATSGASPTVTTSNFWSGNRTDNVLDPITYDVTNGGSSYYSSTNHYGDSATFTIPEYVDINTDSANAIQVNDYMELQIGNRIACRYNKVTTYFQFDSCVSYAATVTWTIQAGDVYAMGDLNQNSPVANKDNVIMVLKSNTSTTMNGHINFSYDL